MKKLTTKKLPENFPVALSGRAVPLGFNLAMNRYSLPIFCVGDVTRFYVWFYEYHGLYWFGFSVNGKEANSVPYISPRNCVGGLRLFLRSFGYRFDNRETAEACIKGWCALFVSCPKASEV